MVDWNKDIEIDNTKKINQKVKKRRQQGGILL